MDINSFNEPTKHPFDTFGKVEIESFMWWFFSQCYKKKDLNAAIETKANEDPLVDKGLLHKVADKKYRLTKESKAKLFSVYGKDYPMSKIAIKTPQGIVADFPWGPVVETHSIGEYFIVEYLPQIFKGCHGTGQHEETKTSFHPYINGKDTSNCFASLDMALIGCICQKYDGINTRAPDYIYPMLGMGESRNS